MFSRSVPLHPELLMPWVHSTLAPSELLTGRMLCDALYYSTQTPLAQVSPSLRQHNNKAFRNLKQKWYYHCVRPSLDVGVGTDVWVSLGFIRPDRLFIITVLRIIKRIYYCVEDY